MCLIKENLNYAIVKTFKIDFKIINPEMKEQKSGIFQTQDVETSRKIYIKNCNQIQPVDFRKAHFGKRKKVKANQVDLSSIVFRHKVQKLVTTFISKLRANSIYREPCEVYNSENTKLKVENYASSYLHHQIKRISEKDGLQIGNFGLILWSLISILQITVMVFMFSIMITFPETQKFKSFVYFRMFSIGIYIMDMILSMSVKRYGNGKNLQKLGEIWSYYVHNQFGIDIASILIFPVDLFFNVQTNIQIFLFCLAIIKQINNLRKFEKFEYLFIDTSSKQHYYGLIKVFLANFAIAHFLSVILNFMAQIDQQQNWYSKINIQNQPWYVKYIWGYYWGTNIMLTVGFGDISATNYYEAFALIFIEAFSCITLAYNISYVGALIGSLRQGEKLKKKKLKIFHRMCKENFISNQTESKVANFIEVEHKIKQQFEYQAHDEVLKGLPVSIQRDFRKQANGSLFQSLGFLNNFLKKGLVRLAEKIERRVYHPEQIIFKRGFVPNFSVLQAGSLGFVCRIRSNLDGQQIERISVGQSQKPKIVTLEFIKNKALNYNIKSNSFSVLFYLSPEQLIQCIRGNDLSYQTYLMLKEKQDEIYEGENHTCSLCKKSCHTKFECSRLHYVPLNRHVIFKHLYKLNNIKQKRASKFRRHKSNNSSLPNWYQTSIIQRRFIQQKFGDDHLKQAEDLCKFYSTKQVQMQELMGKSSIIQLQFMKTKSGFKNWGQRTFSKLEKLFQTKDHMHNDFWEIQSDAATNYKFYFNEGNPDALPVRTRKFKQSSAFII